MSAAGLPPEMPASRMNEDGSISFTEWVRRGGMIIRRDALDVDDPEHPVAVIEALGGNPDEYGYRLHRLARDKITGAWKQEADRHGIVYER